MDVKSTAPVVSSSSLDAHRNKLIVAEISFTFVLFMFLYRYFMGKLRSMSSFAGASDKSLKNIVVR